MKKPHGTNGYQTQSTRFPARKRFFARVGAAAIAIPITVGLASVSATTTPITSEATWLGTQTGANWSNPANWSYSVSPTGQVYPNNGSGGISYFDVSINPPVAANLDVNAGIADLSVASDALLNVNSGESLAMTGANLANDGTIVINSSGSANVSSLVLDNSVSLAGTGTLRLNGMAPADAQILGGTGGYLTVGSGSSITGSGQSSVGILNNGTIDANVAAQRLFLTASDVTNNNLIEAAGGGILTVQGIAVTQGASSATILAAGASSTGAASTVVLRSATIDGGELNSSGPGQISIYGSSTLQGVTNNAAINILDGQTLNVAGNLTNNGTINVNQASTASSTSNLTFSGGTISGTGFINLSAAGTGAELNSAQSMTFGSGQTVDGQGTITSNFTNDGTINANVSGQSLILGPTNVSLASPLVNNNLIEATNGGLLQLPAYTGLLQGPFGIISANGGNVLFGGNGGVVQGILQSANGGEFIATAAGSYVTNVTSNAVILVPGGSRLSLDGSFVDNARIQVGSGSSSAYGILDVSNISGPGTITLVNGQVSGAGTTMGVQAAGHTIDGVGVVSGLNNHGLINANVAGGTLVIGPFNASNSGTIEATNGSLIIENASTTISNDGTILADGGYVGFAPQSGTSVGTYGYVDGGTLKTVNGGTMTISDEFLSNVTIPVNTTVSWKNVGIYQAEVDGHVLASGSTGIFGISGVPIPLDQNSELTGTGTITFSSTAPTASLADKSAGGYLTIGSGLLINGSVEIGPNVINNGEIEAQGAGQYISLALFGGSVTNNNLISAGAGGVVVADGNVVQGSNGKLQATAGGLVVLGNSPGDNPFTLTGGYLDNSGDGHINVGQLDLAGVINLAALSVEPGATLEVSGNFENNGVISFQNAPVPTGSPATPAVDQLLFSTGTLSGTGAIELGATNAGVTLGTVAGATLTQASQHTVSGYGTISATMLNDGTINANSPNQTILVNGLLTNNGLAEASNGGTLEINANSLTNYSSVAFLGNSLTGGVYESASGGNLNLVGGTVQTNAAYIILDGPTAAFAAVNALTANTGTLELLHGATLSLAGGLSNSGTIVLDPSTLNVAGNYLQSSTGLLNLTLDATTTSPLLQVAGTASLNGSIQLSLAAGFTPAPGTDFTLISAGQGIQGTFLNAPDNSLVDGLFRIDYLTNSVEVQATPEPSSVLLTIFGAFPILLLSRRFRGKFAAI